MSSIQPIDPKDQGSLKQLDTQLQQYLEEAQQGKPDKKALANIEQQIKALAKNKNIPESVRMNLQSVLQSLKSDTNPLGPLNLLQNSLETILPAQSGKEGAVHQEMSGLYPPGWKPEDPHGTQGQ